jgi:hypothetical protein
MALTATAGIGGQAALASSAAGAATPQVSVSNGSYYYVHPVIPNTTTSDLVSASSAFTIPSVTCTAGSGEGESFGLDAGDGATNYYQAVVEGYCTGTTPTYQFYLRSAGFSITEPGAYPGDHVVASFLQTAAYQQSTIHDLTSGYTWVANSSSGPLVGYASVGVNLYPLGLATVAPFTKTKFTSAEVNGDYIGFQSPTVTKWYENGIEYASATRLTSENIFTVGFVS